jgi:hypothetical protein
LACGNDVYVPALVVGCLAKEAVGSWEMWAGRKNKSSDVASWILRTAGWNDDNFFLSKFGDMDAASTNKTTTPRGSDPNQVIMGFPKHFAAPCA